MYDQWRELDTLDQTISNHTKNSIKNLLHFSGIARNYGKSTCKNVMLAGSAYESAILARIFLPLKTRDKVNKECEFDLEFVLIEVPIMLKDRIESTGKNGFARIKLTEEELGMLLQENGWNFSGEHYRKTRAYVTENGYLNPSRLKQVLRKAFRYTSNNAFIDAAFAVLLNESFNDVTVDCVCPGQLTRSSVMIEISIKVKDEVVMNLSYDAVVIIRLAWWPKVADEWENRDRSWPDDSIIKKLTSCCYMIPKPLKRTDDDEHDSDLLDFRYTFSHIERELISLLSNQQHLVYFIFKSTFYKHIKSISPERIQSYSAKTVMLWVCEKFPPNSAFWGDDWQSTIDAIIYLLNKLLHHFQNGYLEHYFIRQINVIDNIPLEIKPKILEKLHELIMNIDQYIPQNLCEVFEFGELLRQFFGTGEEITDVLLNKNQIWRFMLIRPKLLIRTLYCFTFNKHYHFHMKIFVLKVVTVLMLFCMIFFISINFPCICWM